MKGLNVGFCSKISEIPGSLELCFSREYESCPKIHANDACFYELRDAQKGGLTYLKAAKTQTSDSL